MSDKLKTHAAGCQPHGDQVLCIDPPMCFAPARWVCSQVGPVSCSCEIPVTYQPPPGRACTATVVYGANIPADPLLVPMEAHCDAAGAAIALSVMLSRLLGAP